MLPKIYCRTHYLPYIEFEIADQQSKTLSMYLQYQNRLMLDFFVVTISKISIIFIVKDHLKI